MKTFLALLATTLVLLADDGRILDIPGFGRVSFPTNFTAEEVQAAIRKGFVLQIDSNAWKVSMIYVEPPPAPRLKGISLPTQPKKGVFDDLIPANPDLPPGFVLDAAQKPSPARISEDKILLGLIIGLAGFAVLRLAWRTSPGDREVPTTPRPMPFAGAWPTLASGARRLGVQRFVVLCALLLFVGSLMNAPWLINTARTSYDLKERRFVERTEFAAFLTPPQSDGYTASYTSRLRFDVLALEWVAITAVAGGLLFLFRKPMP